MTQKLTSPSQNLSTINDVQSQIQLAVTNQKQYRLSQIFVDTNLGILMINMLTAFEEAHLILPQNPNKLSKIEFNKLTQQIDEILQPLTKRKLKIITGAQSSIDTILDKVSVVIKVREIVNRAKLVDSQFVAWRQYLKNSTLVNKYKIALYLHLFALSQ